jgi:hypothetical protein
MSHNGCGDLGANMVTVTMGYFKITSDKYIITHTIGQKI